MIFAEGSYVVFMLKAEIDLCVCVVWAVFSGTVDLWCISKLSASVPSFRLWPERVRASDMCETAEPMMSSTAAV